MKDMKAMAEDFFAGYESNFNKALKESITDPGETTSSFASYFVEASPKGVMGGRNDESFREQIPRGYDFYRSIGTTGMYIMNKEISLLDEFHIMVKVHWKSCYSNHGKEQEIEFDVHYLLQVLRDQPRIFAYITGDEQKVLKEAGLIE